MVRLWTIFAVCVLGQYAHSHVRTICSMYLPFNRCIAGICILERVQLLCTCKYILERRRRYNNGQLAVNIKAIPEDSLPGCELWVLSFSGPSTNIPLFCLIASWCTGVQGSTGLTVLSLIVGEADDDGSFFVFWLLGLRNHDRTDTENGEWFGYWLQSKIGRVRERRCFN